MHQPMSLEWYGITGCPKTDHPKAYTNELWPLGGAMPSSGHGFGALAGAAVECAVSLSALQLAALGGLKGWDHGVVDGAREKVSGTWHVGLMWPWVMM